MNSPARPLADEIRPSTWDDVVGQSHILGNNGLLRRVIDSGLIPNMIFYGPSGTGKTTVASIIAAHTNRTLHKLNATTAGTADIKEIISSLGTLMAPGGVLLYLDEIQYFNKKQQQSLLEFTENGLITLIASTTENPYFYVYNAILSRSTIFEFKPVGIEDVRLALRRAVSLAAERAGHPIVCPDEVETYLAAACGGDVRKAVGAVELLAKATAPLEGSAVFSLADAEAVAQRSAMRYDRDGDVHYDILSAFQKSIRGSDPNAAVHYLARLLAAGDLPSVCRRLLVTAAEDIGLAYPQAIAIAKACVDAALQVGLPEAQLPLAEAVILLATAPKSNAAACAIWSAMSDVQAGRTGDVPPHLKDSHYKGAQKLGRGLTYRYPHDFPNHYVPQQYLPDEIKDVRYYEYGANKTEQAARRYWEEIGGS
ncbi:MAG: replication-associated recombination protein A [Oscillospiraceae bacterium]|jgi:putative ATPase|nr:replication-associated recombination protein A [Oscillospiraceae bacterium]